MLVPELRDRGFPGLLVNEDGGRERMKKGGRMAALVVWNWFAVPGYRRPLPDIVTFGGGGNKSSRYSTAATNPNA